MRKHVLAASLACACCAVIQVHAAAPRTWVVEAAYPDQAALQRVASQYEHVIVERGRGVLRVETDDDGIRALEANGLVVQVDLAATARLNAFYAQLQQAKASGATLDSIPGYACFRTVEETYSTMDSMQASHPDIVAIDVIGPTWKKTRDAAQGYDMRALRITNLATAAGDPDRPKMVVLGSIHAREYAPAELATRFAEWLVDGYGRDAEATWLVDHNDFRLVPEANPDSRKVAETGVYQRKNQNTVDAPCSGTPTVLSQPGVDLNRNFPFHWNITHGEGSSGAFCSQTYRGPLKGSEPETRNVMNYVAGTCDDAGDCSDGVFADRRDGPMNPPGVGGDGGAAAPDDTSGLFLDIHSNAASVGWPWGDTGIGVGPPNETALRTLGRRLAWFNGYLPAQANGAYKIEGDTVDTMYGLLGVAGFTLETDGSDFFQDCGSFETTTVPTNLAALRYAARSLHAAYRLPAGPDALGIAPASDLVVAGESVQVSARIDDTRFNQSLVGDGHPATIRTIGGASATVDALPWDPDRIEVVLAAADGVFDATAEDVVGSIDTAGLAPGRHFIHVQGADALGNRGPPNATMIDVVDAAEVGTLAGRVSDRITGAPLVATVTLSNAGDSHAAISRAADGAYRAHAYPGRHDAHVGAPHHLSEDLAGLTFAGGAGIAHDFALVPACTLLSDDVENGNQGWTAQPPWVIQATVGGHPTHAWNTPGYGNNLAGTLTSTARDLAGYADLSLDFDDRCATEGGRDFGQVDFSTDGGSSWASLYRCSGQTGWQSHHIELPSSADGAGAFRLRFRLGSNANTGGEGWAIDNVRLEAGGDACRAQYGARVFDLNQQGLTGSWANPATESQGIVLTVLPDLLAAGRGVLFGGWFTWGTNVADGPRWYTLQGDVTADDNATIPIYLTTGGSFDSGQATSTVAVGQAVVHFDDCTHGSLQYAFSDGSGRTGTIPLSRLLANVNCTNDGTNTGGGAYLRSGAWADTANSGQGLVMDFNPPQGIFFAAWYTFLPNAAPAAGAAGQHWYTLQATIPPTFTALQQVGIHESIGGVFDQHATTATTPVGTATITWHTCSTATFDYTFTAGPNAGTGGTLDLVRIGPEPPGCTL